MSSERFAGLALMHLHSDVDIDIDEVCEAFISKHISILYFVPINDFVVIVEIFFSSFSVKCEMAINTYFNSTAICHDRKISLLNRDYSLI